jgi:GNAT superfamily N-acetyltransferase
VITWGVEPFPPFLEEAKPLFPLHWEELALDKDKVPLDPQYEVYLDRDRRGEILLIVGRSSGKLMGYFIGFVAPGLHYRTCLTLTLDIFWVHPEYRGRQGVALFRTVEREAQRRGVMRMFVGSKLHKDADWLFEKLGYTEVEHHYSCWLGD